MNFSRNFQANLYKQFIKDLPNICNLKQQFEDTDESGTSSSKLLTVSLQNSEMLLNQVQNMSNLGSQKDLELDIKVALIDLSLNETQATYLDKFITIPLLTKDGMFVNGQRLTFTNLLEPAKGWQLEHKSKKGKVSEVHGIFRPERGSSLVLKMDRTGGLEKYVLYNNRTGAKCALGTLLRAFLDCSWESARLIFGNASVGLDKLIPSVEVLEKRQTSPHHLTIEECKRQVIDVFSPYKKKDIFDLEFEFKSLVLNNTFYSLSANSLERVKRYFSFYTRGRNCYLNTNINLGVDVIQRSTILSAEQKQQFSNGILPKGLYLTPEVLLELDNSQVEELNVLYNGTAHTIISKAITNSLSVNHFINIINVLACELNGFQTVKDLDDIENKTVTNAYTFFQDYVLTCIDSLINAVIQNKSVSFDTKIYSKDRSVSHMAFNFNEYYKTRDFPAIVPITYRNSVSAAAQHYKITSGNKNPTLSQRELRNTVLGFICAQGSPESDKSGITQNLTALTYSNKYGELCNFYNKVVNGIVTDEVVSLTSFEVQQHTVATHIPKVGEIKAWKYGEMISTSRDNIEYVLHTPSSVSSRWAQIAPYFTHNKSRRVQMSGNHADQFVPTLGMKRRKITSGFSSTYDEFAIRVPEIVSLICFANSVPYKESYCHKGIRLVSNTVKEDKCYLEFASLDDSLSETVIKCIDHYATVAQMVWHMELNLSLRKEPKWFNKEIVIKPFDLLTTPAKVNRDASNLDYGNLDCEEIVSAVEEKDVGMGIPMLVAVHSFRGICYEDGTGIRQSFIERNHLGNVFTHKLEVEIINNKFVTTSILNHSGNSKLQQNGLPILNRFYADNEVICEYKMVRTNKTENGIESKATYHQLKVKEAYAGYVQSVKRVRKDSSKEVLEITIGGIMLSRVGDKLTGGHGNKGIICKIIPDSQMPCLRDGTPIDLLINPLGIPSRMNLGQMLELEKSSAVKDTNEVIITSPFDNSDNEILDSLVAKNNRLGDVDLYDPTYLRKYPNKVNVGYMYYMKLDHSVDKKCNAINEPEAVSAKTGQPVKSASGKKGQKTSELSHNAILANGCTITRDFMFAAGSDDADTARKIRSELIHEGTTNLIGTNSTYKIQHSLFRLLGFDTVGSFNTGIGFSLLTHKRILEITKTYNYQINSKSLLYNLPEYLDENQKYTETYISADCGNIAWVNPAIFNMHLVSVFPVINPKGEFKYMSSSDVKEILDSKKYIAIEISDEGTKFIQLYNETQGQNTSKALTGGLALFYLVASYTKQDCLDYIENKREYILNKDSWSKKDSEFLASVDQHIAQLKGLPEFEELITNQLLITPLKYRPKSDTLGVTDSLNTIYSEALRLLKAIKMTFDMIQTPEQVFDCNKAIQKSYTNFYKFWYEVCTKDEIEKYKNKPSVKSPLHLIKDKESGITRPCMYSKTQRWSGRSTIVGDVELPITQCGLPVKIAYTVYAFHMVKWLRSNELTKDIFTPMRTDDVLRVIEDLKYYRLDLIADRLHLTYSEVKNLYNTVYEIVDNNLWGELVTLVREPSLQRQNATTFIPRLTRDSAIRVNILICPAYNADFDGDQMAVEANINSDSKAEIRKKQTPAVNYLDDQTGDLIYEIKQDMILGYAAATMFDPIAEPVKTYTSFEDLQDDMLYGEIHCKDTVRFNGNLVYKNETFKECSKALDVTTTVGRLYANLALPFGKGIASEHKLLKDSMWSRKDPTKMFDLYAEYEPYTRISVLDSLKATGLFLQEIENTSLSLNDFREVLNIDGLREAINDTPNTDLCNFLNAIGALKDPITAKKSLRDSHTDKCMKVIKNKLPHNNLFKILTTGARGSVYNLVNSLLEGGYVKTLSEEYISTPIDSSLFNGLNPDEVFNSGYEVRNTQLSTTGKTREGGELNRLYSFAESHLEVREHDCGAKPVEHPLAYCPTKDSVNLLNHKVVGQYLSPDSQEYQIVGKLKVNTILLNYLLSLMVPSLTTADGEVIQIEYEPDNEINYSRYVNRFGYALGREQEILLTKKHIDEYTAKGVKTIPVRLTWDCKTELGICQCCVGVLPEGNAMVIDCGADYESTPITFKPIIYESILGKVLSPTSNGYNLIGAEPLTDDLIDVLKVNKVIDLVFEDGSSFRLASRTQMHRNNHLINHYVIDPYTQDEIILSKENLLDYLSKGITQIKARTPNNCLCTNAICQHCSGIPNLVPIGTNLGLRSAQSISKTITQLALDKKNAVTEQSSTTDISAKMKGMILLSNAFDIRENALFAAYDQIVDLRYISETKAIIYANGSKSGYTIARERLLAGEGQMVTKGQKLVEGSLAYGVANSILPISTIQEELFADYMGIYRNNSINILSMNFELLVKAQTSGVRIITSEIDEVIPGTIVDKNKLINFMKLTGKSVEFEETASGFFDIMKQTGALKAICSRDPLRMVSECTLNKIKDYGTDVYSKVAVGSETSKQSIDTKDVSLPRISLVTSKHKQEILSATEVSEILDAPETVEAPEVFDFNDDTFDEDKAFEELYGGDSTTHLFK